MWLCYQVLWSFGEGKIIFSYFWGYFPIYKSSSDRKGISLQWFICWLWLIKSTIIVLKIIFPVLLFLENIPSATAGRISLALPSIGCSGCCRHVEKEWTVSNQPGILQMTMNIFDFTNISHKFISCLLIFLQPQKLFTERVGQILFGTDCEKIEITFWWWLALTLILKPASFYAIWGAGEFVL